MQKTLLACDRVGLLSGLLCAAVQKPRAGMVISGSAPYLKSELAARRDLLVLPVRICSIVLPIQVVVFLHPLYIVANGSTRASCRARQRRILVIFVPRQHRPNLAGHLVSQRYRDQHFGLACANMRDSQLPSTITVPAGVSILLGL